MQPNLINYILCIVFLKKTEPNYLVCDYSFHNKIVVRQDILHVQFSSDFERERETVK